MLRKNTMQYASQMRDQSLSLIVQSALSLPRAPEVLPFDTLAAYLIDRHSEVAAFAAQLAIEIPAKDTLQQVVAREELANRALQIHNGRDVFLRGKQDLWQLWEPFQNHLLPSETAVHHLQQLIGFETWRGGKDSQLAADYIAEVLTDSGFGVSVHRDGDHAPILCAHRGGAGAGTNPARHILCYQHYDTVRYNPKQWHTNPLQPTLIDNRVYGLGIGDNKAALAIRLAAIAACAEDCPTITFLIQGEEECGSPHAHKVFPRLLKEAAEGESPIDFFLEESGYFETDGSMRLLHCTTGSFAPPRHSLVDHFATSLRRWKTGDAVAVCHRYMNKDFFAQGCPYCTNLPHEATYLSFGLNDAKTAIHQPNESVPLWALAAHEHQFKTFLSFVANDAPQR